MQHGAGSFMGRAAIEAPETLYRTMLPTTFSPEFTAANPLIDLTALTGIEFIITTNGTASVDVRMGFDDIQFE